MKWSFYQIALHCSALYHSTPHHTNLYWPLKEYVISSYQFTPLVSICLVCDCTTIPCTLHLHHMHCDLTTTIPLLPYCLAFLLLSLSLSSFLPSFLLSPPTLSGLFLSFSAFAFYVTHCSPLHLCTTWLTISSCHPESAPRPSKNCTTQLISSYSILSYSMLMKRNYIKLTWQKVNKKNSSS